MITLSNSHGQIEETLIVSDNNGINLRQIATVVVQDCYGQNTIETYTKDFEVVELQVFHSCDAPTVDSDVQIGLFNIEKKQ